MTYEETIEWLFAQLPMYQRQGQQAYKKDLTNILKLDIYLNHPSQKFKSIHVGGTNGKGSVSHMLASILQEAGYKTGLYTSPHLKDFRERIRINRQMIRKNCVINFVKRNRSFFEQNGLSFFEMTVGLAFEQFAKKQVDIAIVEVGLGGRLDSTNIIKPEISIITNISKDHTAMLGNTLAQIAFEKAGIIKENTPVIIGKKQLKTKAVFDKIANQKSAPVYYADDKHYPNYNTGLKGFYQQENIKTVLASIEQLRQLNWSIPDSAIVAGLKNVVKNTSLRGRWDILKNKPMVIADTAHNEAGIKQIVKQLKSLDYDNLHFVISMVNDKDIDKILVLLPKKAVYYFSKAKIPRGLDAKILQQKASAFGLEGRIYSDIPTAYQNALKNANQNDLVFIGGSTFTVAEVI